MTKIFLCVCWLCFVFACSGADLWIPLDRVGVEVVHGHNEVHRTRLTLEELRLKWPQGCLIHHIHAVTNASYLEAPRIDEYLRHQAEWGASVPDECLVTLYPLALEDLPTVSTAGPGKELKDKKHIDLLDTFRAKYDMLLVMITAMEHNLLATYFKWVAYSDIDVIFSNVAAMAYDPIKRMRNRRYKSTAEATWCGDGNIQACDRYVETQVDGVAALLSTDGFPFTQGVINAGMFYFSVSRVSKFILHATLSLFNVTLPPHSFDDQDQGRLSFVLQETFDLNHDYIRSLFAPLNETILHPACWDDQILLIRKFNLEKALNHPYFHDIAQDLFPEGHLRGDEQSKVAIVCSKWFNSGACTEPGRLSHRQELTAFTCGDYAAHFYGCDKEALLSSYWRRKVARPECRKHFPWKTNSDGSPFNWDTFLAESKPLIHDSGVFEPILRPWLRSGKGRCDSWNCASWGLENSPRHTDKKNQFRYAGSVPEILM